MEKIKKVFFRISDTIILREILMFLLNWRLLKMSSNSKLISEKLKYEIAKELGVYDQVKKDGGWGNIPSKTCGNIVTKAIEIANRKVEEE